MDEKKIHSLIISQEFLRLCCNPTSEEYTNTEQEVVYRGCPHPIEVWNGIILYDFVIYDICRKWEVPFYVREMNFKTKHDALYYACTKFLENPDLSTVYYRYLIGRAFQAMKKVMVDVQYGRRPCPYPLPDFENYEKAKRSPTSMIAAEIFNIAPGTVSRYGSYATALDTIADRLPAIAEEIFTKQITFSIDATIKLAQGTNAEILMERDKQKKRYQSTRVIKLGFSPAKPVPNPVKKKNTGPAIKQMPKYDPDAEVSSLTLTIPTWISSMKRTQSIADFSQASPEAIMKLKNKLMNLSSAVREMIEIIREESNE